MSELMPSRELSDIVSEIIGAAVNPSAWPIVADRVVEATKSTSFVILEYDLSAAKGIQIHMSTRLATVAGDMAQEILDGAAEMDNGIYEASATLPLYNLTSEAKTMGFSSTTDMVSNPFRDEVLRRTGAKARNLARINDIGPFLELIGLHAPYPGDPPKEVESFMNFLIPVIGKSLETGRIIRNLTHNYGALLDVFDLLDFGAAICEESGRIVIANARFNDTTKERDAISEIGGVVGALNSRDQTSLAQIIANAQQPEVAAEELITTLTRRSGRLPFVAKTAPIRDKEFAHKRPQLTLLLLLDPEDQDRLNALGLAAFGVLSPAEIEVCTLLVQGFATTEIATLRDTTVNTTQGQIKAVSAKLACRSRLDLVRLAIATTAPVKHEKEENH